MPKSKSRNKAKSRSASQRYQLHPDRKQKHKPSPRWYGVLILGLMIIGVVIIVTNYMQVLPGTDLGAKPVFLFVGLGFILVGFIGTTRWR